MPSISIPTNHERYVREADARDLARADVLDDGFQTGDMVRIEAEGAGRVVLTKVDDLVDRYSGSLATGGELRRSLQALRDEW